jgi:phosphoglycolate phosphatase
MPKQFDLLIFDWDGTLADSARTIVNALQRGSRDAGAPIPDDAAARGVIGLGLPEALLKLFPDLDELTRQRVGEGYKYHYHASEHEVSLFDGVEDAMQAYADAGFMLAVATGKGRNGLNRAMELSGFGHLFHATRCVDDCFSKPHPQMLEEIMDELGVIPEKAVMIGDSEFDLQMARNAHMPSLGVSYGAMPEEKLIQHAPLACFDSFAKLHAWLNENA